MERFAKLFEDDSCGQILVMLDSNYGPEIKIFFKPKGLGVCSLKMSGYTDDDEGWEIAEKSFEKMDSKEMIELVKETMKQITKAAK